MSKSRFVEELEVDALSYGTVLCLWSFRACAVAGARCRCVDRSFHAVFGDQGPAIRAEMTALVAGLVASSRRQLWMAPPASLEVTCDELSVLNALAVAQHDHREELQAFLRWLLASDEVPIELVERFVRAGALLYSHGYAATPPTRQLGALPRSIEEVQDPILPSPPAALEHRPVS